MSINELKADHERAKEETRVALQRVRSYGNRAFNLAASDGPYDADTRPEVIEALLRYRAASAALDRAWRRVTNYYDAGGR